MAGFGLVINIETFKIVGKFPNFTLIAFGGSPD